MPWCGCMWKLVGFKASKVSTKMNYGILVLKTRKRLLCVWLSQERRKLVEWTTNRCEKWSLGNLITKRLRFMTGPRKSMMRLVQQKHILCSFYLHIYLGNRSNNIGNYFDGTTFTAPELFLQVIQSVRTNGHLLTLMLTANIKFTQKVRRRITITYTSVFRQRWDFKETIKLRCDFMVTW